MKIVILYSGGLDSYLMYRLAQVEHPDAEIICLFIAHGQNSEAAELDSLPEFVGVKQIDWLNDEIKALPKKDDPFAGAIYIPGRNLLFSVMAACLYLPDQVWMGTVWDEDNPNGTDKNEQFREETSQLLSYVLSPFLDDVNVIFPFVERGWTKELAVANALRHGVTEDELRATVSCWYHDGELPCGKCKQCIKRYFVFALNGFQERYHVHPLTTQACGGGGTELIGQYLNEKNPNRDEANMQDMIRRYFGGDYRLLHVKPLDKMK